MVLHLVHNSNIKNSAQFLSISLNLLEFLANFFENPLFIQTYSQFLWISWAAQRTGLAQVFLINILIYVHVYSNIFIDALKTVVQHEDVADEISRRDVQNPSKIT